MADYGMLTSNTRLKAYKKQYDVACFNLNVGIAKLEKNWQLKVGQILIDARIQVIAITGDKRAPGFKRWYEEELGVEQRSASRYMQIVPFKKEVEKKGVGAVMVAKGMTNDPMRTDREKSKTGLSSTSDTVPFVTPEGTEIQIAKPDKNSSNPVARGAYHRRNREFSSQIRGFFKSVETEGRVSIDIDESAICKPVRNCTVAVRKLGEVVDKMTSEEKASLTILRSELESCIEITQQILHGIETEGDYNGTTGIIEVGTNAVNS